MNELEQNDSMLIERIFLRIGSAETDDQFQNCIEKFLIPVLMKLTSSEEGIRKKVMELLVHINKRVKSQSSIQLPVLNLLQHYLDQNIPSFTHNFLIIYIKLGFPRLNQTDQTDCLPLLLKCCENKSDAQKFIFFQIFILGLQNQPIPSSENQKKKSFLLSIEPTLLPSLFSYMTDFILLSYSPAVAPLSSQNIQQENVSQVSNVPPGLSVSSYKALIGDYEWTGEEIERIKLSIVQLLGSGIYDGELVAVLLLIASADPRHGISNVADTKLKQVVDPKSWEKIEIVKKLFSIFLGTTRQETKVKEIDRRKPASVQLRIKILTTLLKSVEASQNIPSSLQLIFDCLFGTNSNARLKILAVQFVHHLCQFNKTELFYKSSPILFSGLLKLLNQDEDVKLRCHTYLALGKIAQCAPDVASDLKFVHSLFDSIPKETNKEVKSSIQDCLIMLSTLFTKLKQDKMLELELIIMKNVEESDLVSRLMAVRYASTVFPPDHIPSRYVLLLACGDVKEEVYSEASKTLKCLHDTEKKLDVSKKLMPDFEELVEYIYNEADKRIKGPMKFVIGNKILPFKAACYIEILQYMRQCLAYSAYLHLPEASFSSTDSITVSSIENEFMKDFHSNLPNMESLEAMQQQSPTIGIYVNRLLEKFNRSTLADKSSIEMNTVFKYVEMIKQLLVAITGVPAMYCLLEIVAVSRQILSKVVYKHKAWIKSQMFSFNDNLCNYAAQLFAIITIDCESHVEVINVMNELISNLKNQNQETQQGSMLCLGYIVGQVLFKIKLLNANKNSIQIDDVLTLQNSIRVSLLSALNQIANKMKENKILSLSLSACTALGEMGRSGYLPLEDGEERIVLTDGKEQVKDGKESNGVAEAHTKLSLINMLIVKLKSDNVNTKLREKTALCLGQICVGEANFKYRRLVITNLLDTAAPKQQDLHWSIGDALLMAAQGSRSKIGLDVWTCTESSFKYPYAEEATDDIEFLLSQLLDKYIKSPNPHIRQAASIWLLTFVKAIGDWPEVQKSILKIQSAFMSLLGESDELTQEVVSKGLGIVYEKGDADQKQKLVSYLVDSLTMGKKRKADVSEDSALFDEGFLGKTPEGQGMTTYKELCSIANDLNQPDLIYKFMHLANHNATLNLKKGIAYGFSTIAAQAGDQLSPHLDKIVPKLYRYQFDPNPKIQQAMIAIWNSLVKDKDKTITKYLKEILTDINQNLTNPQWRIRESSCFALSDLLRGRSLDDVVDLLPVLWVTCFRVRDDIKETVRKAADSALKSLSKATIKLCDVVSGSVSKSSAEKVTNLILPSLLEDGLSSTVEEVRALSLTTLMKLSKNAGSSLKGHIPTLVVALLESITTLEPQMLNYLSLHAAANENLLEKIDNVRMASYKTSPMMDVINYCIQQADADVLTELVPRIIDLIKGSVGIGTKLCCSAVIVSLVQSCPKELAPFTGKILAVLVNGLNERNISLKKSHATCIGHLAKISKSSSIENVYSKFKLWYLEKDDDSIRQTVGISIESISKVSIEAITRHSKTILPLVFLAMHQKIDKDSSNNIEKDQPKWEEIWQESTTSMESGIKLYLSELIEICTIALKSNSWSLRYQGATSIKTLVDKVGSQLEDAHLQSIIEVLLSGLPGRTWTGKDSLIKALCKVCLSCKDKITKNSDNIPKIDVLLDAFFKEYKKDDMKYRITVINSLVAVIDVYEVDRIDDLVSIILPIIEKKAIKTDKEDDDDDDDLKSSNQIDKIELKKNAFEALSKCWPSNSSTQEKYQEKFCQVFIDNLGVNTWQIEVLLMGSISRFIKRWNSVNNENIIKNNSVVSKFFNSLFPILCQFLGNSKISTLRNEAISLLEIIFIFLSERNQKQMIDELNRKELLATLENINKNDSLEELKKRAQKLIEDI